jgi:hypothetical protein
VVQNVFFGPKDFATGVVFLNETRRNAKQTSMKTLRCLIFAVMMPTGLLLSAEQAPAPKPLPIAQETSLTKFNLDFPGGTPAELVAAIQKAMGRPLNAIVPPEYAGQKLPALKMNGVDVAQLFQALQAASRRNEARISGDRSRQNRVMFVQIDFGFRTEGPVSDNSIWTFWVQNPPEDPTVRPQICRFYLLAPYLDRGFTVDDLTTAVQTGWKMLGDSNAPQPKISFHKETKLLIAVGEPEQLQTIDAVLGELGKVALAGKPPGNQN